MRETERGERERERYIKHMEKKALHIEVQVHLGRA
jgi:hypothetical protein